MKVGRLHLITDTTLQTRLSALELARAAAESGVETIQYREKKASTRHMVEEATAIAAVCRRRKVRFIVNDRVDVALAVDSDGVHLGDEDLPLPLAREILGPDRILGGSADNAGDTELLLRQGADYAGIGPIFETGSKTDTGPVLGLDGLVEAVNRTSLPLIAIGGITLENVSAVLETGVHGVAVLSAICWAEDPAAVTVSFRKLVDS